MLPAAALDLAESQLGVIARYQLCDLLREGQVEAVLLSPSIERLLRGIYRVRGGAVLPEQHLVAASLRSRPGATVTGPAVLARQHIEGFDLDSPFAVLTRPGRVLSTTAFAHREDLALGRTVDRLGAAQLAVPLDAFLESAPYLSEIGERPFRVAWDRLRYRSRISENRLRQRAEQLRSGTPQIDDLLALLEVEGLAVESEGERRAGRFLTRFTPAPEAQAWVATGHRLDWYFRELRFALEYQGRVDHAGRSNRDADTQRTAELERIGIVVYPIAAEDLDRPDAFLAALAGALAIRAAKLGVTPPRLR